MRKILHIGDHLKISHYEHSPSLTLFGVSFGQDITSVKEYFKDNLMIFDDEIFTNAVSLQRGAYEYVISDNYITYPILDIEYVFNKSGQCAKMAVVDLCTRITSPSGMRLFADMIELLERDREYGESLFFAKGKMTKHGIEQEYIGKDFKAIIEGTNEYIKLSFYPD